MTFVGLSQLLPRGHMILFHGDFFGRAKGARYVCASTFAQQLCLGTITIVASAYVLVALDSVVKNETFSHGSRGCEHGGSVSRPSGKCDAFSCHPTSLHESPETHRIDFFRDESPIGTLPVPSAPCAAVMRAVRPVPLTHASRWDPACVPRSQNHATRSPCRPARVRASHLATTARARPSPAG